MDTPILSIVIPVYNAEKYLSSCIEALVSAQLSDTEILLIDDGSTDGSREAVRAAAEKYPYIRGVQQENAGPSAARNRGIELSHGKYIAFLDSDDTLDPAAFRRTVSLLDKVDAQLWISDFRRVTDSGRVLDRVYQIRESAEPIIDIGYMDEFLSASDCVWNVWRCLFSREFLDGNDLRFMEGASIAEDLEFMVRALTLVKKPAFFHNPYYDYRVNYGATLTRKYTAERVRQFTEMCLRAKETLDGTQAPFAGKLRNKLAREYVLNLAVCRQVPKSERREAIEVFRNTWSVLDGADCLLARLARAAAKTLGLRLTAGVLYRMKRMKRAVRGIKEFGK